MFITAQLLLEVGDDQGATPAVRSFGELERRAPHHFGHLPVQLEAGRWPLSAAQLLKNPAVGGVKRA